MSRLWNQSIFLSLLLLIYLKDTPKKYYLIVVNENRYDSLSNKIKNTTFYFGAIPKKRNERRFEQIVEYFKNPDLSLRQLKKNFYLIRIFFPIHDSHNHDYFQIDSLNYKNSGLTINPKLFNQKNNMLSNKLYFYLREGPECTRSNQTVYRIVELKGNLQYMNSRITEEHIKSNTLALLNIEEVESGGKVFNTTVFDQVGQIKNISKEISECSISFEQMTHTKKTAIDFDNERLRDTILYINDRFHQSQLKFTRN